MPTTMNKGETIITKLEDQSGNNNHIIAEPIYVWCKSYHSGNSYVYTYYNKSAEVRSLDEQAEFRQKDLFSKEKMQKFKLVAVDED